MLPSADRIKTYEHLKRRIPDELNVLFVQHGKVEKNALGVLAPAVAGKRID